METELLTVGTEILLGDILNSNVQYLSRQCAALGFPVRRHTTVGDNRLRLLAALEAAFRACDLVILTGGLGPTEDDLTKETVFEFFGLEAVLHQPSWDHIQLWFSRLGRPMSPSNRKQALFPLESLVLANPVGTAPGCVVHRQVPAFRGISGVKTAIVLPGPPSEMQTMFTEGALPWLQAHCHQTFVSRTIHFAGIGESEMEEQVKDLLAMENPTLAPYAKTGECLLRLTARAADAPSATGLIAPVEAEIRGRLGQFIYGYDDDTLGSVVLRMLTDRAWTLALAESCTGGLLSSALVDNPGASTAFVGGVVAYSNRLKQGLLGVGEEILASHGAVSGECAAAMARGVCEATGATLGLSVTGIAGPDGGSPEKPVGTVWFGLCRRIPGYPEALSTHTRVFRGRRSMIRERSVIYGLQLVREALQP